MATIKFRTRIAHATDREDSLRYALRGTLVTPEGFAVATDGRIAACSKAQVSARESGNGPAETRAKNESGYQRRVRG